MSKLLVQVVSASESSYTEVNHSGDSSSTSSLSTDETSETEKDTRSLPSSGGMTPSANGSEEQDLCNLQSIQALQDLTGDLDFAQNQVYERPDRS